MPALPLRLLLVLPLLGLAACRPHPAAPAATAAARPDAPWPEVEAEARGQTVDFVMWQGNPAINAYFRDFVIPHLREHYGITLRPLPGQGSDLVSRLMTEREAGRATSEIDVMWINGETFYQLRQIDALFGPFTDRLPNARSIDFDNPFIGLDFQQPVDGYEAPWGNVQLLLIYDAARVGARPPRTRAELLAWVRAHPGRFTFDTSFTGMTLLKSLLYTFAADPSELAGPFDAATYDRLAPQLWAYLRELQPHLWREGRNFPESATQQHQLLASGEIDFSLSMNDGEVDNKIGAGLLPATARAYTLDTGTIQNSHYLGIAARAADLAGALVTVNFLLSPEAQLEKQKTSVWGDGTVLDVSRLPPDWAARFADAQHRTYSPPRSAIQDRALPEPASEYMIRLHEDFRRHFVR